MYIPRLSFKFLRDVVPITGADTPGGQGGQNNGEDGGGNRCAPGLASTHARATCAIVTSYFFESSSMRLTMIGPAELAETYAPMSKWSVAALTVVSVFETGRQAAPPASGLQGREPTPKC